MAHHIHPMNKTSIGAMEEEIYRIDDLVVHYANVYRDTIGEKETFAVTAEELEHRVRQMVQDIKAKHPDAAPSFWSEIDAAGEGKFEDVFASTFRC